MRATATRQHPVLYPSATSAATASGALDRGQLLRQPRHRQSQCHPPGRAPLCLSVPEQYAGPAWGQRRSPINALWSPAGRRQCHAPASPVDKMASPALGPSAAHAGPRHLEAAARCSSMAKSRTAKHRFSVTFITSIHRAFRPREGQADFRLWSGAPAPHSPHQRS